jgi:hypothetical protein
MIRRVLVSVWLSIVLVALTQVAADAKCQICYDKKWGGGQTWDVVGDSCSDYIFDTGRNVECTNLSIATPPDPHIFDSLNPFLDNAALTDTLPGGGQIMVTLRGYSVFVRPDGDGGREYAILYPKELHASITQSLFPGDTAQYPPFEPVADQYGVICPGGIDFAIVHTYLNPTTREIENETILPVNITSLTFIPESTPLPPVPAVAWQGMLLLALGVAGTGAVMAFRYRRVPKPSA